MIEISHRPIAPGGLPGNDAAETGAPAHSTDTAQPDPWAPAPGSTIGGRPANFDALFGAPPNVLRFYADKNGAGGGGTTTTAQIGGPKAPTLKPGCSGAEVRVLQQELNKWRAAQWPRQDPIAENGRYTAETKKAVEAFQKTNGIPTGTLKLDMTPNGVADVRVQNRLRLENDPTFAKLDPEAKQHARTMLLRADRDGVWSEPLFTLLGDPAFQKLGVDAQITMLSSLATFPRYREADQFSNAQLVKEFTTLARNPEFGKLDPRIQIKAINLLTASAWLEPRLGVDLAAKQRGEIDSLTKLVTSPAFGKLHVDDQAKIVGAFAINPSDKKLADAMDSLIRSPQFDALKPDEKTAVVSQIANYPDDRSVTNMERLLKKDWFRTQDLDDKQRSLKTIAYLSQHDKGHRETIDNTLDKLLGAGSKITLEWEDFSQRWTSESGDAETRTFGEATASTQTLVLNSQKLPAGNGEVPKNYDGKHLVLHTVAHEVNHLLNKDAARPASFNHFETEYRAWAVGFKAEHGHWPTNAEAMKRVSHLLTAKDGGYADIKKASGKYHDAMALFSFIQQMTGFAVTAGNIDAILKSDPDNWINRSRDPDERGMKQRDRTAPIADGSLDNK